MNKILNLFNSLGIAIVCLNSLPTNYAVAEITSDTTLPENSRIIREGNTFNISGGTSVGSNLFHSFSAFSVPSNGTASFNNDVGIENIISRVTGGSVSYIDGLIKANGTANLFLINPNGIIFGSKASLQIGGSFVASTASSVNFDNGTKFSASDPQTTDLLRVNVPIGLQFGATAATIQNQSQALDSNGVNVGLQVQPDRTLALVGGDIKLSGGNLTATSGRIELGSVAGNSLVSLTPTNQGWLLGYRGVQNFHNIQLMQRTDETGRQISSQVNASNGNGSKGNLQVQGNTIELIGDDVYLRTQATGAKDGGDLTINANKLIIRDGASISTTTIGTGNGGNLTVNASESVEVTGSYQIPGTDFFMPSSLSSGTSVAGKSGDLVINTKRLLIQDRGQIATESLGLFREDGRFIAGTGTGGDLTVNATESLEVRGKNSGLFASTFTSGNAGKLTINTGQLIVRDQAQVSVSSIFSNDYIYPTNPVNLGKAGDLNITARSIVLDNKGTLSSDSYLGQGGNITLQVRDLLLMRRNSQISTNAGTAQSGGDGGNITINAPSGFLVAAPNENSDITANAFSGTGGKITINAKSIFGFVPRTREDLVRLLNTQEADKLNPSNLPTNDITAFSQQNPSFNGTVQISSPDVDPSQGLVELPVNVLDTSRQVVASCNSGRLARNKFTVTGRGGIPSNPTEPLMADAVLAPWITLQSQQKDSPASSQNTPAITEDRNTENMSQQQVPQVNQTPQIVEAQGWRVDANGNVVLVATAPNTISSNSTLAPTSCATH